MEYKKSVMSEDVQYEELLKSQHENSPTNTLTRSKDRLREGMIRSSLNFLAAM